MMRAVVCERWGGPEVLTLSERPIPTPEPGWVLVRVRAFGLNRAELFTRQGDSPGVELPRVIGIECVGEVVDAPDSDLTGGQRVAALMGGMGRQFDGSYAEYTCVPRTCVLPIESELPWEVLGAIPEMLQTTLGSLRVGLEVAAGQTLLVRGGTSSIGRTAIRLAKKLGLTVLATTRSLDKADELRTCGADEVVVDGGTLAEPVRALCPNGVDRVLDLIGTTTLHDSLRAARVGGIVCMTGILGGSWSVADFQPFLYIPTGVKLTAYSGGAEDLQSADLQAFVDDVASGAQSIDRGRTFRLDEIVDAHRTMEANRAKGKLVVLTE
jgi:NADPH:quinone reductase-like Zn-dependent oxidoreductase